MAQQLINIGTAANDGTGDSLRAAGGKINSNFTELYGRTAYTLPIATNATLGGVKVGDTLQINASTGVLSLNASLDNLTDVTITAPVLNNQVIKFDGNKWINSTIPTVPSLLDDLTDVVISSPANNQVLKYNGTEWINAAAPAGATNLDGLTDVTLTSSTNGQVLKYNGAQWVNAQAFDQILNTTNQVEFVTTTADEFILGGSGTPTLESETDIYLSAVGKVKIITKSPFKLASMTTAERDALTGVENGDMIYNTSTNKFQGRAGGAWVDLH